MALIEATDLRVVADLGHGTVPVLRDLAFALEPGRILGLVGESGAGKTMVGRTMSRLLPANFRVAGGRLKFEGEDLLALPPRRHRALLGRRIAFIPQEPMTSLNPVHAIGRQFGEHLRRLGVPAGERRQRIVEQLAAVHLPEPDALLGKYPHQLSGGMCQRVLIAMAFASDPALIIADEPTTALDVTIQARIMRLIVEIQARHGTALILITHDLKLAARMCDDILVMYGGAAVEAGPAKTVFGAPRHPYTRSLQLANPPISGPRRDLLVLPEHMPGLAAMAALPGCLFAPRCPLRQAACEAEPPPPGAIGDGHTVRCLRAEATPAIAAPAVDASDASGSGEAKEADRDAILSAEGLWKRFAGRRPLFGSAAPAVDAVRDVSLSLYPGELVGIVGESGSGKTTLARLIMGLEQPDRGRIAITGRDVTDAGAASRLERIRTVQMVFQDPQSALNPRHQVAAIITQVMSAGSARSSREERRTRATALLADIGLPPETASRYAAQLSGGQRQRVNIARALCARPRVLVADEIVSGLDVSVQAQLLSLLQRLTEEHGLSMLFISHDLSVVRHLCHRVMVMYRGEVVESGPTEQVLARPRHDYTRELLAAVPPDDLEAPWAALAPRTDRLGQRLAWEEAP